MSTLLPLWLFASIDAPILSSFDSSFSRIDWHPPGRSYKCFSTTSRAFVSCNVAAKRWRTSGSLVRPSASASSAALRRRYRYSLGPSCEKGLIERKLVLLECRGKEMSNCRWITFEANVNPLLLVNPLSVKRLNQKSSQDTLNKVNHDDGWISSAEWTLYTAVAHVSISSRNIVPSVNVHPC